MLYDTLPVVASDLSKCLWDFTDMGDLWPAVGMCGEDRKNIF